MAFLELNEKEYRQFTENNHTTHFLQSYEWGQISKTRGLKPIYVGIKNNNKILCTALLLKKTLPLGYSYFYIPRGFTMDYSNLELLKDFTLEIKNFCQKQKALFFRIDPDIKLHTIDSNAEIIEGENNYKLVDFLNKIGYKRKKLTYYFETMQPRYTFRIPLDDSIENIEKRYSTTTIQRIKKAENLGVYVEKGSINDLKEFITLMRMTEKRQDFYSHTEEFYYNFFNTFKDNTTLYLGKINTQKITEKLNTKKEKLNNELDEIKSMESKKINSRKAEIARELDNIEKNLNFFENKPKGEIVVSSYLTVTYGNKSWALYAANDMEYKTLYTNYLVYKNQIRDAKNNGIEIFDVFGTIGKPNNNSHLVGLHDFKRKWGGEYIEFIGEFDYIINKPLYFVYTKVIPIRHKIINKILRKKVK